MAVSKTEKNLVFDIRLSSVVPGKITGKNKTYDLKGIDLAMKLHCLKGLYFFTDINYNDNGSEEGDTRTSSFLSIHDFKNKAMFDCLVSYFKVCGRIRLSSTETGERPSIKLNDAGIRIIEARARKTVEEWLAMESFGLSLVDHLVYNHGLGPDDLSFSPLVCLQVTWFKCGGISLGLSWAHVLGDAFSASEFMNMLGQYMQGCHQQPKTLTLRDPPQSKYPPPSQAQEPISVKRVNPVGNHWILPSNSKIGTYTIHLTPKQLDQFYSRVYGSKMDDNTSSQYFEVITSIVWKSIANIRKDMETGIVTICRPKSIRRQHVIPYNGQVLGTITTNFLVSNANPLKLVNLMVESVVDESGLVEELVDEEISKYDFYVYGANLTFVDMEEASIYGFQIKGNYPRFASFTISEVGDKGAVLVLPGPKDENGEDNGSKLIVLLLPENEIEPLKNELQKEWCIA